MGYGVMTFPIYDKGALVEEIQPGRVVELSIRFDDIQVQEPYTLDLKESDVFSVAFCADKEAVGNDFYGWSHEKCLLSNKLKVKELM